MKTWSLCVVVMCGLCLVIPKTIAQGFAPNTLAGYSAIGAITSGTGYFASTGAFRIALARAGSAFSMSALTSTVSASAGTYSYTKTGPNTAYMVLTDVVDRIGVPYVITFTSQTSGIFTTTTIIGSQTGLLIIEDGVLESSPVARPTGFANMSVRAQVPLNGHIIPGLVLDAPTRVLIRVAGPALAGFGVTNTLPNPRLTLMAGSTALAANDDWAATTANRSAVEDAARKTGAFPFFAGNTILPSSRDAALVVDLAAGAYTCIISGDTDTSGEVILEVYRVPQ